MTQSIETIERRINALGLTEPIIQQRGGANNNEILVQLPGEGDPSRAKAVIQAGGQLELKLVEDPTTYPSQVAALAAHGGVLPPGSEIMAGRNESSTATTPNQGEVWYVLSRSPVVTGRDLRSATENRSSQNPGQWQINFSLSADAARRFGPFTEQNINRQMAIVLQHRVYSAPVIHGRIDDTGVIEGNFSQDSAHDLALVLRAGALPASIKYLEERTVGPSLGADSIRHGVQASVLSLIVVMLFMLVYYRLSGANAVVALILNLVILLAALAAFGAVLTLPGIAGVILTIGMGVDSNVLVFERIREELRQRQILRRCRRSRLRQGLPDHYRHARHHRRLRVLPVPFRNRSDSRVRHHPDHWFDRQRFHRDLRVQNDFPIPPFQDGPAGGAQYLNSDLY